MQEPIGSSAAVFSDREAARGRWLVLGAAFFWGTSATLARFVFRDRHVPPLAVVELRLWFAFALLGLWMVWRRRRSLRVDARDWFYFGVLGIIGVAAVQGSYYYTISTLGVGLAILLQYLAPSLVVIYELARGRPVHPRTAIALMAAVVGTLMLVGGVDRNALAAAPHHWIIGFGSAFIFAFYIVFSKRGLERYPPETVLFYTFGIAGLFWACFTPPWKILAARYSSELWILFLALGVGSTLIPFALFYAGLRRLPTTQVGILATVEPVVAVLTAALFLREGLGPLQWGGATAVLAASMLASAREPVTPRPPRA